MSKLRKLLTALSLLRRNAAPAYLFAEAESLERSGRLADAEQLYLALSQQNTKNRVTLEAAAKLAYIRGDFRESSRVYDLMMTSGMADANIYYRRGNVRNSLGLAVEAVEDYDAALELDPTLASALCNRGVALGSLGQWGASVASYDRALKLQPLDRLALYNKASALRQLRRFDDALESYDAAIRVKPDYVEAQINRGHLLQEMRRYSEAIASYSRALALSQEFAEAYQGRGTAFEEIRDYAAASKDYTRAMSIDPRRDFLQGQRRNAMMQICEWHDSATDIADIVGRLQRGEPASTPFTLLGLVDMPRVHRRAAEIWAARMPAAPKQGRATCADQSVGKVRIGFFSADFREHPVARLATAVFESIDRARFETIGFSLGPRAEDPLRHRLEKAFDRFIDTDGESDVEIFNAATKLSLDIAVDMGGYTAHSRPGIFAMRPAPIQVGFLGYPGTVGADWMDYLVGDATVFGPQSDQIFEKPIIMPGTYLPYEPQAYSTLALEARQEHGLPADSVVFCCFNNSYKLSPSVFDSWMRVLVRVPSSVFWLSHINETATNNLRLEASRRGVDPARLIFAPRLPSHSDHLSRHRLADLFLDTWPYNAHATAMDALYAGLPVLTRLGEAFAGRVAGGILNALGMPELITRSAEEFEEKAIALARDREGLMALHRRLDALCPKSPVFSAVHYTRQLQDAFLQIHTRHRSGLPPAVVRVPG